MLSGCKTGQTIAPANTDSVEYVQINGKDITDVYEDTGYRLRLDFNTLNLIVEDKINNAAWMTNPQNPDADALANTEYIDIMRSQLSFSYYKNRALQNMYSFNDCVFKNQFKVFKLKNGLRIEYTFGDMDLTIDDIPKIISEKRFDMFVTNNQKLSEDDKSAIVLCYDQDKKAKAFRWKNNIFGSKATKAVKAFQKAGYTTTDLKSDAAEFGEKVSVSDKLYFMIPVEYTIKSGRLNIKIPVAQIVEPKENPITNVNLLEFFGAAKSDLPGYIVLPDGCGSLINFDKNIHINSQLSLPVYSDDKNIGQAQLKGFTMPVSMPVFGLKSGGMAFWCEINDADAIATINVTRAGRNSSYNSVFPSFILKNQDIIKLGDPSNPSNVMVIQDKAYSGNIEATYGFLYNENASYQGMAKDYRDELIKRGYPKAEKENEIPFFLELVGAIESSKSFLGINYTGMTALTTFKQAELIANKYRSSGIENIKLIYSGWFNGAYNQNVPDKIRVEGELGGLAELKKLARVQNDLYPSVSFLTAGTDKGLTLDSEAAKTIEQNYSRLYLKDMLTNQTQATKYIISPAYLNKLTDQFLSSYNKLAITNIFLADMGNQCFADYSKKNLIDRQTATQIIEKQLQKLAADKKIIMNGVTSRTGRYANGAVGAPLYSSKYFTADEEIPFFQMVFHGLFNYAGNPINLSSDFTNDYLRAVSYGASLYFVQTYADSSKIIDSSYTQLTSTHYLDWIEKAVTMQKSASQVLQPLADIPIVNYIRLHDNIYQTIYENGVKVTVNYSGADCLLEDGVVVPGKGFLVD
jgi:hypothetical protein